MGKLRKLTMSLLSLILMGMLLTVPAMAKDDHHGKPAHAKQSLVAIGDSITFGYNLGVTNDHPYKGAFPYLIGKEEHMRVRDLGIPGWTTTDLLQAVQTNEQFRQAIHHADVITLDIGSNDLLSAVDFTTGSVNIPEMLQSVPNMLTNVNLIISNIRTLTNAPIVVYNIYNPFQLGTLIHSETDLLLEKGTSLTPGINQLLQASVSALPFKNIVIADAYDAFGQDQSDYVRLGDVHPTILGQEVLATTGEAAFDTLENQKHTVD